MRLRHRLTLIIAVALVVTLAIAGAVTYSSFRSFLYGRLDDQVSAAQFSAYRYLTTTAARGHAVRQGVLADRVSPDIYVMLVSHQGKVLMTAPSGAPFAPDPRPLLPASLRPAPVPKARFGSAHGAYRPAPNAITLGSVGTSGMQYRASAVAVPQGILVVAESLTRTGDTLSSFTRIELLTSLSVLLVLCLAAFFTLRRGLRPLEEMAKTTEAIAAGDLSQRVPTGSRTSEVGRFGLAFNAMLARIERAFSEKSESEERLRQFVADASHELRTPLTSIRGYTELLRKGAFTDEESRSRAFHRVEREADRMGLLVSDLLLLASLDRGRPLERVPVDLSRVAADAVDDARAVDPGRPVELSAPGPVLVLGDRDRLGQVVHNLVRNALAHTPAGTAVQVAVGSQGSDGYVRVVDEGPGLSERAVEHAFDRFYREDAARTGGGSGLGLSIVRAIAEALGGTATVRSSPGAGATFEVTIPLNPAPVPTPEPVAPVSERVRT
jgi:two-component system, OmpR family, sensor kinase